MNQLASFALFRFFNLSRIQGNAILTFLNTSNDVSTIELPTDNQVVHVILIFVAILRGKRLEFYCVNQTSRVYLRI